MVTIKFKKLNDQAVIPQLATEGSACFDLTANRIEEVAPGKLKIFFGLACEIPEDYKLCIVPRSSFCHKDWVMQNSPGQVDSDYRGEIAMFMQAFPVGTKLKITSALGAIKSYLTYPNSPYKIGDRCAQAFLQQVVPTKIIEANELTETTRGTGGWGSTGKGIIGL